MKRRAVLAGATPALLAGGARAQSVARVGFISLRASDDDNLEGFRRGLRQLGRVEGRNLAIEERRVEPDSALYAAAANDLAGRVDVLLLGGPLSRVAPETARRVPTVFVYSGDPVAAAIVPSLARPGGNATGVSLLAVELAGKRIALLKEAAPALRRLGAVTNPGHPGYADELAVNVAAARGLGVEFVNREVRRGDEFAPALESLLRDGCDGITSFPDALTLANRDAIIRAAAAARAPTMFVWRNFTASGGLMSYGPNVVEAYARAAYFVDRILKGTKPADLPVELPTVIEFVLNAGTARALDVTFPPALMLSADEVIE